MLKIEDVLTVTAGSITYRSLLQVVASNSSFSNFHRSLSLWKARIRDRFRRLPTVIEPSRRENENVRILNDERLDPGLFSRCGCASLDRLVPGNSHGFQMPFQWLMNPTRARDLESEKHETTKTGLKRSRIYGNISLSNKVTVLRVIWYCQTFNLLYVLLKISLRFPGRNDLTESDRKWR